MAQNEQTPHSFYESLQISLGVLNQNNFCYLYYYYILFIQLNYCHLI